VAVDPWNGGYLDRMTLTITIIVLALLALALLSMLTGVMAWPRHLRRHRPAGGRPAARLRGLRRRRER
jgi:hypothetical protein